MCPGSIEGRGEEEGRVFWKDQNKDETEPITRKKTNGDVGEERIAQNDVIATEPVVPSMSIRQSGYRAHTLGANCR